MSTVGCSSTNRKNGEPTGWGEQDAWIGAEHGRRLAELIPGAGFELIPGAGHLVQHDAPVVLADRIRRWLGDGQGTATLR